MFLSLLAALSNSATPRKLFYIACYMKGMVPKKEVKMGYALEEYSEEMGMNL